MSENYINSIIKGFKVLELFDRRSNLLGITEISQMLNYPISTTFRIVSTLEYCGYLRQDLASNKYCLGTQNYKMGLKINFISELKRISYEYMKELSFEYNEVTHLAVLDNDKVLCIQKISVNRALSATPEEGETNYAHATSAGKCMLAFTSGNAAERFLQNNELIELTENTITEKFLFLNELKKIREDGCAVDYEESEIGLTCVGAPIFDSQNKCVAAISISVPNARLNSNLEQLKNAIKIVAKKISLQL